MKKIFGLLLLVMMLVPVTAFAAQSSTADDVVAFGHSVTVAANETADGVIVFGGGANIQGSNLGDTVAFGGSVTVSGSTDSNVFVFGGTAQINGPVDGDVVVFGGSPVISARISGNLLAIGGSVHLRDGAEVMGDVFTVGGSVSRSGNAVVHGSVQSGINPFRIPGVFGGWWAFSGAFHVWRLLSILFLGLICYWLFPLVTERVAEAAEANPVKAVVAGLLGYLAIVPVIIVLAITLLGIPLIPVFLLALLVARLFGQVALALFAGRWLAARLQMSATANWLLVTLGLLGLGVLTLLPLVGVLASLFYSLIGFGAVIVTRFGTRRLAA